MADHRHKRVTRARLTSKSILIGSALALTVTVGAVTVGVATGGAAPSVAPRPADLSVAAQAAKTLPERGEQASRAGARSALVAGNDLAPKAAQVARQEARERAQRIRERKATQRAVARAKTRLFATENLNVWSEPEGGRKLGLVDAGDKVLVTGRERDDRVEIVVGNTARWVSDGYLSEDEPFGAGAGLSMAPCPRSNIEGGLTPDAVRVFRSVCAAFPQITSYGGYAPRGEHGGGEAIDIMTSDYALGTAIADFLRAHAAELNLYDIIWRQRIFTPGRAGEGWRSMSDRGSATANHYDHVHVKVN